MAEGFLFYSALSDLNFGYINEATAKAVASVCRKSIIFDVLLLFPFNIYLSWQATDSSFCRTALLGFAILLRCYYVRGKEPKQLGKQLLSNYNPHHSWLGLTEHQNLTLFRGWARI